MRSNEIPLSPNIIQNSNINNLPQTEKDTLMVHKSQARAMKLNRQMIKT